MPSTTIIPAAAKGADYVRLTDEIKTWLLDNGISFVIRYCVPPESTKIGKAITAEEVAWLHANGIAVLLNWEINALDGLGGAVAGTRAGVWLKARAAELGCPTSVPLICSIDTDTYAANIAAHTAYVRAFAAAIAPHPVGLYGDVDIATAVADLKPLFWRPNASAWGAIKPGAPTVHVQQQASIHPPGVDPNTAVAPFTAWLPTPDIPAVPDVPQQEEEHVQVAVFIEPQSPAFEFEPGKQGVFTVDGQPVTGEYLDALRAAGVQVEIVKQPTHPWWDEATLHKIGEQARRLYGDTPES